MTCISTCNAFAEDTLTLINGVQLAFCWSSHIFSLLWSALCNSTRKQQRDLASEGSAGLETFVAQQSSDPSYSGANAHQSFFLTSRPRTPVLGDLSTPLQMRNCHSAAPEMKQ